MKHWFHPTNSSLLTKLKALSRKNEKGQSVVIIALVFVGLLAFIGLTVDMGILFISYGNLRRAVDSAALAAASQYREGYDSVKLTNAATEFLQLNNVMDASATVDTCNPSSPDPALCPTQRRKLVRVTASVPIQFAFLPVIGFYGTTITAHAIAEAASMDVVLVIDTSESMANEPPAGHPEFRDPAVCNPADISGDTNDHPELGGVDIPGECHPFEEVKAAAADNFAKWVLNKPASEEEDRLAIVTLSDGWEQTWSADGKVPIKGTAIIRPTGNPADGNWISDQNTAVNLIHNLNVYQPDPCPADYRTNGGPGICSLYTSGVFDQIMCPWRQPENKYAIFDPTKPGDATVNGDLSTCQTTNIGGGLKLAASMFGQDMRQDAVWLVVLLTDGAANATDVNPAQAGRVQAYAEMPVSETTGKYWPLTDLPVGFCPEHGATASPPCRDNNVLTRYTSTNLTHYDAEDYARDNADLVSCDSKNPKAGCSQSGQGAVMFSIGLGSAVFSSTNEVSGTPYGDSLLRYIANIGDDGDPATDPCSGITANPSGYNCGNYFFSPTGTGLNAVFDLIASRIYTKITK